LVLAHLVSEVLNTSLLVFSLLWIVEPFKSVLSCPEFFLLSGEVTLELFLISERLVVGVLPGNGISFTLGFLFLLDLTLIFLIGLMETVETDYENAMQTYADARNNYETALGNFEYTKAFFGSETEEFFIAKEELTRAEGDLNEDKHILSDLRNRKAQADADDEVARARAERDDANAEAEEIYNQLQDRVQEGKDQIWEFQHNLEEAIERQEVMEEAVDILVEEEANSDPAFEEEALDTANENLEEAEEMVEERREMLEEAEDT
jgi:hypothetical protein